MTYLKDTGEGRPLPNVREAIFLCFSTGPTSLPLGTSRNVQHDPSDQNTSMPVDHGEGKWEVLQTVEDLQPDDLEGQPFPH